MRYLPSASMICAPAGIGTSPRLPIWRMRPSLMTRVVSGIGGAPVPSIRVAPTTTTTEEVTAGKVRVTCPLACRINEMASVKQTSQNESFFKVGIIRAKHSFHFWMKSELIRFLSLILPINGVN